MSDNRAIGVFDSGIGGLTVLREIWNQLPNESTVYFGDNGRAPYGTKSHDTIVKYSLEDTRFLLSQDVKLIVIACNTASAHAYKEVLANCDIPVVEVITPGAREAAKATRNGKIGIIATKATIASDVYRQAVIKEAAALGIREPKIHSKACPLFVSLAEEGFWDNDIARLAAKEYLSELKEAGVDTLVLGCTHYPLLTKVIQEEMGEGVTLINAGKSVAAKVSSILSLHDMEAEDSSSGHKPTQSFFTSDNPLSFEDIASPFLGGGRPSGTRHVDELI